VEEIRFRGKRVDNGKWVYGSLIRADGRSFIIGQGRFYPELDNITWQPLAFHEWWEVRPHTVGQWTGLQDTNSCDIYEDDILRAWESDTSYWTGRVCRHESGAWQVRLFNATHWAEETLWIILRHWFRTVEVIGNTHDNPELLRERRQHDAE
jgi:uncharacterized phage protein (TIGR01671 family)